MKTKLIILALILAAVGTVLALKFSRSEESSPPAVSRPAEVSLVNAPARATVVLFADPTEENAKCGCADIIRMARNTQQISGVTYREFDSRDETEATEAEAEKHGVRVAPTLVVYDAENKELARFEGESDAVVSDMKTRLDELGLSREAAK